MRGAIGTAAVRNIGEHAGLNEVSDRAFARGKGAREAGRTLRTRRSAVGRSMPQAPAGFVRGVVLRRNPQEVSEQIASKTMRRDTSNFQLQRGRRRSALDGREQDGLSVDTDDEPLMKT